MGGLNDPPNKSNWLKLKVSPMDQEEMFFKKKSFHQRKKPSTSTLCFTLSNPCELLSHFLETLPRNCCRNSHFLEVLKMPWVFKPKCPMELQKVEIPEYPRAVCVSWVKKGGIDRPEVSYHSKWDVLLQCFCPWSFQWCIHRALHPPAGN